MSISTSIHSKSWSDRDDHAGKLRTLINAELQGNCGRQVEARPHRQQQAWWVRTMPPAKLMRH